MSNACTRCRFGPRVGVSSTRYAFKLPRSATTTREVGVIAMMVFRNARAERRVSFFYNRFVRGDKIARQTNRDTPLLSDLLALSPQRTQSLRKNYQIGRASRRERGYIS